MGEVDWSGVLVIGVGVDDLDVVQMVCVCNVLWVKDFVLGLFDLFDQDFLVGFEVV